MDLAVITVGKSFGQGQVANMAKSLWYVVIHGFYLIPHDLIILIITNRKGWGTNAKEIAHTTVS